MKTLLAALTLVITPAFAAPESPEYCEAMAGLAGIVMEARQMGMAASKLVDALDGTDYGLPMIMEVYDTPRFATGQYQLRAKQNFTNKVYLRCLKGTN